MSTKKSKDFYEILGISRTASLEDIKKAYKKQAIRWHPDKNPENPVEASEMFKSIGEAYETLSDPVKRRDYDNESSYGDYSGSAGGFDDFDPSEAMFGNARPSARPSMFRRTSQSTQSSSSSSHRTTSHSSSFTDQRAFDIFNAFFADMEDFQRDFMEGRNAAFGGRERNRGNSGRGGGAGMAFSDPFFSSSGGDFPGGSLFSDEFFGGRDPFARMSSLDAMGGMGLGARSSSISFSSSSSIGAGGRPGMVKSRSVSTSTFIGPDGRKVTRKETVVINPDGTRQSNVEEHFEEPNHSGSNRLMDGSGGRPLPLQYGGDNRGSDLRRMTSTSTTDNTGSSTRRDNLGRSKSHGYY